MYARDVFGQRLVDTFSVIEQILRRFQTPDLL